MNLKPWQWWLKQTSTNRLILALALAVVFTWVAREKTLNARTDGLTKRVYELNAERNDLSQHLVQCEQEARQRELEASEEQVKYERERSRQKDSINMALLMAERALKKQQR